MTNQQRKVSTKRHELLRAARSMFEERVHSLESIFLCRGLKTPAGHGPTPWWVSNGVIAIGPVHTPSWFDPSVFHSLPVANIEALDLFEPPMAQIEFHHPNNDIIMIANREPAFGLSPLMLELAIQWLDVGAGRFRNRGVGAPGLYIEQKLNGTVNDPVILSADNGRMAVIAPKRSDP